MQIEEVLAARLPLLAKVDLELFAVRVFRPAMGRALISPWRSSCKQASERALAPHERLSS